MQPELSISRVDILLKYIDQYSSLIESTNGICATIFVISVALILRRIGIITDKVIGAVPHCWLLYISAASSLTAFGANFIVEETISNFFNVMYKNNGSEAYQFCSCVWGSSVSITDERILSYFKCIRKECLFVPLNFAFFSFITSSITMLAWFIVATLEIRRRK